MSNSQDRNRLQRLRIIDDMLSGSDEGYTMPQLLNNLNTHMACKVDRFAVMRDFQFIQRTYGIGILKKIVSRENMLKNKTERITLYSYEDGADSIFKTSLTGKEKAFLDFALSLLDLKGLSKMPVLRGMNLKVPEHAKILSYTKNPKEQDISNILCQLLDHIRKKEVISLQLRDRKNTDNKERCHVCPWYLREYNRRWYLFGWDIKKDRIERYALDRIIPPTYILQKEYREPEGPIDEILKHTVGVSIVEEPPIEIIFWVSDESADYVANKPIHHNQIELRREEIKLHERLKRKCMGGKFFKIYCKINYELKREMLSFNKELIVLYPAALMEELRFTLKKMLSNYEL